MRAPMEPEPKKPEQKGEERHAYIEPVEERGRFERTEMAELPLQRIDLSRWGPIWAGFIATISFVALFGLLGAAIGLGNLNLAAGVQLTGAGVYAGIILLVGLFIGGWLSSRLAAVGGAFLGLIQGSLVWALTIFISLVLTGIGAGALLGSILGGFGPFSAGVAPAQPLSAAFWYLFGFLLVGLIVAAVGGWIGARSPYEAPPR